MSDQLSLLRICIDDLALSSKVWSLVWTAVTDEVQECFGTGKHGDVISFIYIVFP